MKDDWVPFPITSCGKEFAREYRAMMERRIVRHIEYINCVMTWLYSEFTNKGEEDE